MRLSVLFNYMNPAPSGHRKPRETRSTLKRTFAKTNNIDLSKSFFYTDSIDDYPLLEIVGKPIATNPDHKLSQLAFENDWKILRFKENKRTLHDR